MSLGLPARIEAKISPEPNSGCWLWTGAIRDQRDQYGATNWNGKGYRVHRLVYELLVGPIPAGLDLDHLCRVKLCCNPQHLEPVTHKTNIHRGVGIAANNRRKTHCKHGHELTEQNTQIYNFPKGGFQRICKTCHMRHSRAHAAKKKNK